MYYAVIDLDNILVVSIESSERQVQAVVDGLHNPSTPIVSPLRNTLVMPVDDSIWIAYSEGCEIEVDFEDKVGRINPIVKVKA